MMFLGQKYIEIVERTDTPHDGAISRIASQ